MSMKMSPELDQFVATDKLHFANLGWKISFHLLSKNENIFIFVVSPLVCCESLSLTLSVVNMIFYISALIHHAGIWHTFCSSAFYFFLIPIILNNIWLSVKHMRNKVQCAPTGGWRLQRNHKTTFAFNRLAVAYIQSHSHRRDILKLQEKMPFQD